MCVSALPACIDVYHMGAWYPQGPKEGIGFPGYGLLGLQWVLRTEYRSLARASSAFKHWVISPTLQMRSANSIQQAHSIGIPLPFQWQLPVPCQDWETAVLTLMLGSGGRKPTACCPLWELIAKLSLFSEAQEIQPGDLHTLGKSSADELLLQRLLDLKQWLADSAASKDTCHTQPELSLQDPDGERRQPTCANCV